VPLQNVSPGGFHFLEPSVEYFSGLGKFFWPQGEKFLGSEKLFSPSAKSNALLGESNPSGKKLFEGPDWWNAARK
jgi:hypothetical protein